MGQTLIIDCGFDAEKFAGDRPALLQSQRKPSFFAVGSLTSRCRLRIPADFAIQLIGNRESDRERSVTATRWGMKIAVEKDFRRLEPPPDDDETNAIDHPGGTIYCSV